MYDCVGVPVVPEEPACHCHIAHTAEDRTHCPDNVKSSVTDVTHILYIGFMHTVNSLRGVSTTHPLCTAYSVISLTQSMELVVLN